LFIGCGNGGSSSHSSNGAPLSSFAIDTNDIGLRVGDNITIELQGIYKDASSKTLNNKDASFEIDDTDIASVDSSGKVIALSEGNTTLKVAYPNLSPITLNVIVAKELNASNINKAYFGSLYLTNIPKDSTKEKYDEQLFAMITGKVSDESGNPVKDVVVSIHKQREYGTARTDENGSFAIPVEGGQNIIIRFRKSGFATLDREIFPKVQDWTIVPEITLLSRDSKYSKIDMNSSNPRIHSSNKIRDERGERATTLVFERKNEAKAVKGDGSERTLESIDVRATEFKTPESMPAGLPNTTAYTYCADITVDGVGDDENVVFDEPVIIYVDNFLGFEVGTIVPVGYYDRNIGEWVGSENGVVVRLLDTDADGKVDALDVNGDGLPDDLNNDGSYSDEVAGIQDNTEYQAGKTYWRAKIVHFTPYDLNFPIVLPPEETPEISVDSKEDEGCGVSTNSYITSKTQELHEDIDVAGTDIKLRYSSKETDGYQHTITATVDTLNTPSSALEATVVLEIAGKKVEKVLQFNSIENIEFKWDGKDVVGNTLSGLTNGKITVNYAFSSSYSSPSNVGQAWAQVGTGSLLIASREAEVASSTKNITISTGGIDNDKNKIANGWSIEDDLYMRLHPQGSLSSVEKYKYIEVKNGLLFAVDNEPKGRFTIPNLIPNRYYALAATFPSSDLSYSGNILNLASFDIVNKQVYERERIALGTFSQFNFSKNYDNAPQPGYDRFAYYRGTIFDGLSETYLGASVTPLELKQKIRDGINNNKPFIFATNDNLGNLNYSGSYWVHVQPTEFLYQQVDALYSDYDKTLHNDAFFLSLNIAEQDIIVFDKNLGYVYDTNTGLLTKIFDNTRKQVIREYEHDTNGRLISITDQFNNKVTITRDYDGKPTQITAPNGQLTRLFVDQKGDLTSVTYDDSSVYSFSYNDKSLLTSKQTPNNYNSQYYYDDSGRVVRQIDTNNGEWQFGKTQLNNATEYSIIKPEGDKVTYVDTRAFDESISSLIKLPSGYTYTVNSNKNNTDTSTLKDSVTVRTQTGQDPLTLNTILKSQTITMPSGLSKTTTQTIAYTGDAKNPSTRTVSIATNGKTTTVYNDFQQGTVTAKTPIGKQFVTTYDLSTGLTTKTQYTNILPTTYDYDAKGRLIKQTFGTNQVSYTYNLKGNIDTITDAKGLKTSYAYDLLDRVTSVTYPNGNKEQYSYDKEGNVLKYTTPKSTQFDFTHNSVKQRTSLKSPSSKTTLYSYNKNRDLTTITNPSGKKINYIYTNSQLSKISTSDTDYEYTYWFDNKIKSIIKGTEKTNYEYDGELLTNINYQGALSQDISYTYNTDFNPASITYSGKTGNYVYDSDSLLTKSGSFDIQRDASTGLATQISDGTFTKKYSHDNMGYVSKIQDNSYTQTITNRYENSNIKEITEGSNAYAYEYDDLNRLTKVTKNNQAVEQYTYDQQGNRVSSTVNGATTTASYNSDDELTTYGANSYTYDSDGYLKTKTDTQGITTYTYGTLGELREVKLPSNTFITYTYNANNQRVSKSVDGTTTEKYLWLDLTTLLAVYDGSDNLKQRFIYAEDRTPVAYTDKDDNIFYLSYNHLGTLKAVTDKSNNIIKSLEHDSFGNIISDTNPSLDIPLGFAGGLYDKDTKLTRFGYRDYDSYTGRWTAKDPIDFEGGSSNLYGYALNDPVNFIDPTGEWGFAIAGAMAIGFTVAIIVNRLNTLATAADVIVQTPEVVSQANALRDMCNQWKPDEATNEDDKAAQKQGLAQCQANKNQAFGKWANDGFTDYLKNLFSLGFGKHPKNSRY
jgi:RHS repeat-associated protein